MLIASDLFEEGREIRHMHMGVEDDWHVVLLVTTMRPRRDAKDHFFPVG